MILLSRATGFWVQILQNREFSTKTMKKRKLDDSVTLSLCLFFIARQTVSCYPILSRR